MAAVVLATEKSEGTGTVLEPLCPWTSSIKELFYIEHRLYTAKVWHIAQSLY